MNRYAKRLTISVVAAAGTLAIGIVPPALAAGSDLTESTSANWSGYVAKGSSSGSSPQFSSVSGSWIEPNSDCSANNGDAAFWVGLGGTSDGSGALEQVGTQADCSSGGSGQHYAWYELVPAAPVRLDLAISPGDHVSARVSVAGTSVTVSLTDQSTGGTATKTLAMDNPDVSSAEWIAEAPSRCQGSDASNTASCTPVPLADFGTVTFTGASATANGSTGTISSSNWSPQPVQLSGGTGDVAPGYPGLVDASGGNGTSASATPSSLSADGSSFSVAWQPDGSQSASSSDGSGDPSAGHGSSPGSAADGYGSSDGYGGGDPYGAYGGGDPYGAYGGGDPYGAYGSGGPYGAYGGGDPYGGYGAGSVDPYGSYGFSGGVYGADGVGY